MEIMTIDLQNRKLLITGGGTGGGVSPGIAVAEVWQSLGGKVAFVGVSTGKEATMVPKSGFKIQFIKIKAIKGKSIINKFLTLIRLPLAIFAAMKIIKKEKPAIVLGTGGYVAGPTCLAAWILRVPTAIVVLDVYTGMTNRWLGKFVTKIFTGFDDGNNFFSKNKVVFTGNPTRSQMREYEYRKTENWFNILIFGGSQGAVGMNQKIIEALKLMPEFWTDLDITHQASHHDIEKIKNFYEQHQIKATVNNFFDDMESCYARANIVICRAGANSLAELAQTGRPAILIPYPFASDDHQRKNAELFVQKNAAWCFDQDKMTGDELAVLLKRLNENPQELKEKIENVKKFATPNAAKDIVKGLEKMINV